MATGTPGNGANGSNRVLNTILGLLLPPLIGGAIAWCRDTNNRIRDHGTDIAVIKEEVINIKAGIRRIEEKLSRNK
jgi:hypothetical protein